MVNYKITMQHVNADKSSIANQTTATIAVLTVY